MYEATGISRVTIIKGKKELQGAGKNRTVEINEQIITWDERRLVVRSFKHAGAQEAACCYRLTKAKTAIAFLPVQRHGKKRITTLAELQIATDDILKRYQVEGLLEVLATFP